MKEEDSETKQSDYAGLIEQIKKMTSKMDLELIASAARERRCELMDEEYKKGKKSGPLELSVDEDEMD